MIPGFRIIQSDAAKRGKFFGDRQNADSVEIKAAELDIAIQSSRWHRRRCKTELSKIEIAALKGKIPVELIAAIKLVARITIIIKYRDAGKPA